MGFVVVSFHPAINQGKNDCPDGQEGALRDYFLDRQSPEERARLLRPENERELQERWIAYGRGPNGSNICNQVTLFPDRPPIKMLKSNVGWGLDLDGDGGTGVSKIANTCQQPGMVSPNGEKGVDHQVWRAMGCTNLYRGIDGKGGDVVRGFDGFVMSGDWTQVILLKGVDSLVSDDNVEVIYANTDDRPVVDSAGRPIHFATFTMSTQKYPQYRNVLRGQIRNGVLTTEPTLIRLKQTWGQNQLLGARTNWEFRNGQIRFAFQPDGTLKGLVGGYQPLLQIVQSPMIANGGGIASGTNCLGQLAALRVAADGDRDPKTGKCASISSAQAAEAVPAFVNDVQPTRKTVSK